MALILIDNRELEISGGERLNAIEAARRLGIEIPHYCWHPGLSVVGSCRMCLVELGGRHPKTGKVSMLPNLVPACNTVVADGMVIITNSEKVAKARAMVEEGLLLRHPIDCPICDKAGECFLQDYHFLYGQDERRADVRPFTSRRRDIGDVALFVDRCVMCSRCVRFTNEISGTGELLVTGRGAQEEIDVVPGFPLHNNLSGNVVDLCPVGALGDKEFLYEQRVWFMQSHPGICTGCSLGCSIWVEENLDHIYRLRPRENQYVNRWWICNEGRYGYAHVHSHKRMIMPRRREGDSTTDLDWNGLPAELEARLRRAGRLAAVVSPHLTVEEAYLLCKFVRQLDGKAPLVLGPVPKIGKDEHFPGGFAVHAEKCPNRRGVEAVLAHFCGNVVLFEEFIVTLKSSKIRGIWVSGRYKSDWVDESTAHCFEGLELLVIQDLFESPLARRATYALPGAAFAEREGSCVNLTDHLQMVLRAVRPPSGVRTEGSVYWELLGLQGLYNARRVLDEIAREISYFSAAAQPVPALGIDLKVNLLAQKDGAQPNQT